MTGYSPFRVPRFVFRVLCFVFRVSYLKRFENLEFEI